MPAGGKTRKAIPTEWEEKERAARSTEWWASPLVWGEAEVAARPTEWRKTPGGTAKEWKGGSSCRRALAPP